MLLEHQAFLVKQRAHHLSPPDLDPGPSSPSVNGRENQYEEGQVGKEAITLILDPRKSFQDSSIHDETTLPTCPWAGLDIAECCLSFLPPVTQEPREWTSNPGTSVASTSYLTQSNGPGPRPDPAGTQPQLPLHLTCVVADRTICHPCFLHLSPPHLPHVNTAGVNTLTLGPQSRHHPGPPGAPVS